LIQTFLGLKGVQKSLLNGFKGKYDQNENKISAVSLATGNNHFTGFLVGFLINGFIFIFGFFFIICLIIYYVAQYATGQQILDTFLKILPIIVIFIVKFIFNYVCSRFIFLQDKAEYLALDNYRAYSIFLYVTFFFDCFVGVIAAFVRFVIGILGALLYYKRLSSKIKSDLIQKIDQIELMTQKKQKLKNKWYLYYTLINNNSLILQRKKEFSFNRLVGISSTTTTNTIKNS